MDTASTLMGLGLMFIFMAPIGFLLFNQSFEAKKSAKKMAFLAAQHKLKLDEIDSISGISIGMDRNSRRILFLGSEKSVVVDPKKYGEVVLIKTDDEGQLISDLDRTRKISLQFNGKNGTTEQLVFYSEEKDPVTQKSDRLELALKWKKLCSNIC